MKNSNDYLLFPLIFCIFAAVVSKKEFETSLKLGRRQKNVENILQGEALKEKIFL